MRNRLIDWTFTVFAIALSAAVVPGCAEAKKTEVVATPQPVSGWEGVKSVSSSSRFTFAGQPTESALERFAKEGGKVVVDLRTHQGADKPSFDEQARVESLGLKYVSIPVTPATLSRADVAKFAQTVGETKGPVLVHCATSNRVGGLWAAYLAIDKGVPVDQAIADGKAAGMHSAEVEAAARRVISQ